jgi:regulator of replication initiation timing
LWAAVPALLTELERLRERVQATAEVGCVREELDRLRKREAELQRENARLRDELAKERTAHTATRSSLNDALDNPIFED